MSSVPLREIVPYLCGSAILLNNIQQFGDHLDIQQAGLEQILIHHRNGTRTPYDTYSAILSLWIQERGGRKISDLKLVLQQVDNCQLAEVLANAFCGNMEASISLGSSNNEEGAVDSIRADAFTTYGIRDPVGNFTGREEKLDQIDKALQSEGGKAVISAAISGLGGIGKSELARKYAKVKGSNFGAVVWINAESRTTISQSFQKLARRSDIKIETKCADGTEKDVQELADETFRFFCSKYKRRVLFIFDNADNYKARIDENGQPEPGYDNRLDIILPCSELKPAPCFIITSRNRMWKNCSGVLIELGTFSQNEQCYFLKLPSGLMNSRILLKIKYCTSWQKSWDTFL